MLVEYKRGLKENTIGCVVFWHAKRSEKENRRVGRVMACREGFKREQKGP